MLGIAIIFSCNYICGYTSPRHRIDFTLNLCDLSRMVAEFNLQILVTNKRIEGVVRCRILKFEHLKMAIVALTFVIQIGICCIFNFHDKSIMILVSLHKEAIGSHVSIQY